MSDIQELIEDIFAAGPTGVILRIVIILIIAFVAQWIGGRAIRRSVLAVTSRAPKRRAGQLRGVEDDELATTLMEDRQGQRAHALGSLAKNALTIIIWVIAVMMILSTLGVNIAPIIASGAVISAVLGFGAQTYIADYLNGISMIFEDQMGIGDTVELGGIVLGRWKRPPCDTRAFATSGCGLVRPQRPNQSVANQSQGWTYSLVEIPVPYDEDLTKVQQVVDAVGKDMGEDPQYNGVLLGSPYYSNVTELTATSVVVRVNTKIVPNGNQWYAGRLIRQRMKEGLDAAGIRIPYDGIQVRTFQAGVQEVPPKPPGDSSTSTPQATGQATKVARPARTPNADEDPGEARP